MRRVSTVAFQFDRMFDIPGVQRDASALTIHAETGHLWVVTDDRVRLVEFTDEGEFVRDVKLVGFKDTEGFCHLAGDRFAIAEEAKMRITLIEVPPRATTVHDDGVRIELDAKARKNKGLEGISYDAATDTLFAVREDKPPAVYRVAPILENPAPNIAKCSLDLDGLDDLSDVFFDARAECLWLVSHESKAAVAFDAQGRRLVEISLRQGRHGLPEDVPQAEGIARDSRGRLLIASEPNRIYRFRAIKDR
jgi:uncharacterized protein YjiK